jgi:hypothetical protein
MTDKLHEAFKDYFNTPGIELPTPIPPHGELKGGGWVVKYLSTETYVDFFAENRGTNSRHERINADGSITTLETYQPALIFENENDQDWGRASARMEAHNKKVTEILRSKGLLISE